MRLCALFSGGKDSTMTVFRAGKEGHKIAVLLSMIPESDESYMYHVPNIRLAKNAAEAMRIPLVEIRTTGVPPQENIDLKKALQKLKKDYQIEGVAAGAVSSNYQFNIVSGICKELGLEAYAPYWKTDHESLIKEAIDAGFEIIFVSVSAEGLDESWLGRKLDEKALFELKKLSKRFGLSIGGEGGEYETLVLDGPIFQRKMAIKRSKKKWDKLRGELVIEEIALTQKP